MGISRLRKLNESMSKPDHYARLMHQPCRILCDKVGMDKNAKQVPILAGNLVVPCCGLYIDEPEPDDDNFRYTVYLLEPSGSRTVDDVACDGVTDCMLEIEPGIIIWPKEYQLMAIGQAWDIFYCDGSAGPLWQLQAVDTDRRFTRDKEAWRFVWDQAVVNNCPVARHALAFLYYRSPQEYNAVRDYCARTKQEV